MYDQQTGQPYIPLQHIMPPGYQDTFHVWNSPLSEAGVLGFEYGYSIADPSTMVMWEAQFGDFVNNAQVYPTSQGNPTPTQASLNRFP
jgi:2-oxoglutarate dehydrogenase E1 component